MIALYFTAAFIFVLIGVLVSTSAALISLAVFLTGVLGCIHTKGESK